MVKCIKDSVLDVPVVIRKEASIFPQWHAEVLSPENMNILYIQKGFTHSFQTLEDNIKLF